MTGAVDMVNKGRTKAKGVEGPEHKKKDYFYLVQVIRAGGFSTAKTCKQTRSTN